MSDKPSPKVLIVDDMLDVRETVAGLLSDAGYFVKTAASGAAAIHILEKEVFDFIVIDIRLEGHDDDDESGVELGNVIRKVGVDSKIIFVTGKKVKGTHFISGYESGVIDYIEKSNDWVNALIETIEKNFIKFDVFLCHNSEDKPTVKKIGEDLKNRGLKPWLDEWELVPGLPWQRLLEKQIQEIGAAAVFVGSSGVGPWQELEIEGMLQEFVRRGLPVIPVLLPNAPTMTQLPVFLRTMTWVDFRDGTDEASLERLIWGVTGKKSDLPSLSDESVSSFELKPASLHEVFCTTGLPDFTYIEPSIYRDVESDILQPGKHVLIVGPSGSGKTCLLTRILEGLNWVEGEDYLLISCLDEDSQKNVSGVLEDALNGTIKIPVILDDFHVLNTEIRMRLGKKLKQLSDKVFKERKASTTFILLGISTSPQALLFTSPDLSRRLGIYRMPPPQPSDLHGLIERGERKLTVEFSNSDRIVEDSKNSFFICQYLCSRICIDEGVSHTMDVLKPLNYRIEDVRQHLVQQLSEQYKPFLMSFVQNSGFKKAQWLPFIAIIVLISNVPNFEFTIAEIASRSGDLGKAINAVKARIAQAILSYGLDGSMGSILHYEENAEVLSIQDPIFRYYLNHMDIDGFIQSLGLSEEERENIFGFINGTKVLQPDRGSVQQEESERTDIFISYSHKNRVWLEKLQTHLRPFTRNKDISLWVDTQIQAGMKWRSEIDKAIAAAKVAILLVSPEFLASDFIAENELPPLLKSAKQKGLTIIWIPISYSLYAETEIAEFQAAHDPSTPLDSLENTEVNKALVNISIQIRDAFKA